MTDIWKSEKFEIAMPWGPEKTSGYTYRGLGLHLLYEGSPKGRRPPKWILTHLGSGHKICVLAGKVAVAFPVATEIAESGDWDFLSLYGWKDRFPDARDKIEEIAAANPKVISFGAGVHLENSHDIAVQIASKRP